MSTANEYELVMLDPISYASASVELRQNIDTYYQRLYQLCARHRVTVAGMTVLLSEKGPRPEVSEEVSPDLLDATEEVHVLNWQNSMTGKFTVEHLVDGETNDPLQLVRVCVMQQFDLDSLDDEEDEDGEDDHHLVTVS